MSLSFRLCTVADKAAIIAFLDEHWGSAHPLVHREEFFNYYYAHGQQLQFAFAEQDSTPLALAGYIRANACETPDIWVSIWCAVKGQNGAGLELMAALPKLTNARVMACNNIRPKNMAFYTFLGYTAARVPHFYRLANKPLEAYQVARIVHKEILPVQGKAVLTPIETAEILARDYTPDPSLRPYKDNWYLARRYFAYPHQRYDVHGVYENGRITSLLVTRCVAVEGTKVLRLVDYIGKAEQFSALGGGIALLMQTTGAEYADCYCYGIAPALFAQAGFCERTEEDENILPNYLTPPLYENTEYYCFTSEAENFTLFKADGDQDRPNL